MTEIKLLPCPFCGSDKIDPEAWASTERSGPGCDDCGATADTVEIWNKRVALSPAGLADESFEQKTERNKRVQARYNQLLAAGGHGHYETIFRVVREEVERARALQNKA